MDLRFLTLELSIVVKEFSTLCPWKGHQQKHFPFSFKAMMCLDLRFLTLKTWCTRWAFIPVGGFTILEYWDSETMWHNILWATVHKIFKKLSFASNLNQWGTRLMGKRKGLGSWHGWLKFLVNDEEPCLSPYTKNHVRLAHNSSYMCLLVWCYHFLNHVLSYHI